MFLETTPDTSGYMIAGYLITFFTMGLYVLSLFQRNKDLGQDLEILAKMAKESRSKPSRPSKSAKSRPGGKSKTKKI
ncbi:MAG: hypothetical protein FJZ87_10020 [Chloroflexi bacterium]|nr:hypothetical protein [Chloroflexota bacterium]